MARNEAQTRFELIDPSLIERGWCREDIRLEETAAAIDIIHGRAQRRPKGRADYVLRRPLESGAEPLPIAIIEAKREDKPPEHGLQQGKRYRLGHLHHVPFVFSSNGHMFVEYDESTGLTSDAHPLSEFPTPEDLLNRYIEARGLPRAASEMRLLATGYKPGREYLRYYQDASIRAALEQIIRQRANNERPRVLLSLATGAGKTRIAAALLRRIFDAGFMGKALFVCDRTELRDNGIGDFQALFGNDAAEVGTHNAQRNARVIVATYQTLDHSSNKEEATFFDRHYPPGYFDVMVIDECHRSAWGEWHVFLEKNSNAIQVGLTATPRQLRVTESQLPEETRTEIDRDRRFLADNFKYFGEPAYEYSYAQGRDDGYLAPAEIETYDLFHDQQPIAERLHGIEREDVRGHQLTNALTGARVPPEDVPEKNAPSVIEQRLIMPERVLAMSQHLFEQLLATGNGDPVQKTIIFCASDNHADLIANAMNNLYAKWCRANKQGRVETYVFKCMSSVNGQALIPDFRGRKRSYIIATTKELLSTGVNVPCVKNIVFFRYIQSPILFHQMVGRGTRIDEENDKLMFRIFDYTGATALFGADFVSPPPPEPDDDPPPPPPPPTYPPIKVRGVQIEIRESGSFNLVNEDGRLVRVTPEQYRKRLIEELIQTVPTLSDFRERWLDADKRREMMDQLADMGLLPEKLREAANMDEFDMFDVIAAFAYGIEPRTRAERAAQFNDAGPGWLVRLPLPSVKVIRAIVRQFERAGTEALEKNELFQTPEVQQANGVAALREGGEPSELLKKTKETLFVA